MGDVKQDGLLNGDGAFLTPRDIGRFINQTCPAEYALFTGGEALLEPELVVHGIGVAESLGIESWLLSNCSWGKDVQLCNGKCIRSLFPSQREDDRGAVGNYRPPCSGAVFFEKSLYCFLNGMDRMKVVTCNLLGGQPVRIYPYIFPGNDLIGFLGTPLIGNEKVLLHDSAHKGRRRIDHFEDSPILRASRPFAAAARDNDVSLRFYNGSCAGNTFGRLVEIAVEGSPGVGCDNEIKGGIQNTNAVPG